MTDRSRLGKKVRARGAGYECRVANRLVPYYPDAVRGLQPRGKAKPSDVEGTEFWIECKCKDKLWTHTVLKKAKEDRAAFKDERPVLMVFHRTGDLYEDDLVLVQWPLFEEMLAAWKAAKEARREVE